MYYTDTLSDLNARERNTTGIVDERFYCSGGGTFAHSQANMSEGYCIYMLVIKLVPSYCKTELPNVM